MPSVSIVRSSRIIRSPRVQQLEGLFDIAPTEKSEERWIVSLPIEEKDWNIGLIVGPSGCGKSTIGREIFGNEVSFEWSDKRSIIDCFPENLGIKEITGILSSVGFSSPPAWLRPFGVLSTGQKMRVEIARLLALNLPIAIKDEFTSVVDRQVARIGSCAIAKTVRRRKQRFVAASCHSDIIAWLQPDWIFRPDLNRFQWRRLQRRPDIQLEIKRVSREIWKLFSPHHYLNASLNKSASCYAGYIDDQPAVFTGVLSFPHATRPGWRESRTVCLPDYQGIGLGNQMSEFIASLYIATGKPYFSTTSHPSMIAHRIKSQRWRLKRAPNLGKKISITGSRSLARTTALRRITAGFEYVGPARIKEARRFGLVD